MKYEYRVLFFDDAEGDLIPPRKASKGLILAETSETFSTKAMAVVHKRQEIERWSHLPFAKATVQRRVISEWEDCKP